VTYACAVGGINVIYPTMPINNLTNKTLRSANILKHTYTMKVLTIFNINVLKSPINTSNQLHVTNYIYKLFNK